MCACEYNTRLHYLIEIKNTTLMFRENAFVQKKCLNENYPSFFDFVHILRRHKLRVFNDMLRSLCMDWTISYYGSICLCSLVPPFWVLLYFSYRFSCIRSIGNKYNCFIEMSQISIVFNITYKPQTSKPTLLLSFNTNKRLPLLLFNLSVEFKSFFSS